MEENKETKLELKIDNKIYKWIKILESIMLLALGVIFIVVAVNSNSGIEFSALQLSVGVVCSFIALFNIFAGYILHRSPFNGDVLSGLVYVCIAVILFVNSKIFEQILPLFIITFCFGFAAVLIGFGVDKCIGKSGIKKSVVTGVFSFIFAAVLIALSVIYLIFQSKASTYLLFIIGGALIFFAFYLFITTLVKAHNSSKLQEQLDENSALKEENDLYKESMDKIFNAKKKTTNTQKVDQTEQSVKSTEPLVIDNTDKPNDEVLKLK